MAKKFLVPIDLSKLELQNAVFQNLASAPGSPVEGQFYYDTTDHTLYVRTNSAWVDALAVATAIAATAVTYSNATSGLSATNAQTAIDEVEGRLDTAQTNITALQGRSLSDFAAPTADLSIGSHKLTNVTTPTADSDGATKGYVDAAAAGIDWKKSVRAATTAAGTLASSFENGDTIDGVVLATGDRILIKDQATGADNGIYTVNASGAPTRAVDADANAEVTAGLATFVEEGTANADSGWVLTTNGAIVVGTTALAFSQFTGLGQITAGAGLTKTGNTVDVVAGTGVTVNANDVAIDTAVVVRKFAASVGDGAATSYNVDHNLGTLDVTVGVYRNSDGVEMEADITRSTTNRVVVAFAVAPSSNQYRVVVHG